ncbi:hypothetical protein A1O1_00622 [Capronia coronata CBS 617.96]|uniref:Uncharacterized protein n=1 Tax=Capronia coronata CBS 617.96 TaxID=1182541 RepID=W9Z0P2_9EURO|nr:uncharacterized protein A1O1_00622 [Capronia coronata CBS 617.96]EXJ95500.1 hypothetical protein A1O1_00622 [Capronia coronata CBS 617.96]
MSPNKSKNDKRVSVRPPAHPVPQLQKPFEESMIETINQQLQEDVPTDALTRRSMLLEAPTYERVIAGRWKQKPGERYHPLWKLVAQMSFGMHLLAENMAISEEEVMRILQAHVDDIDGFLERTTDDFNLAQSDIHERIRCLKLPLAHGHVFDRMLEDRAFRASILEGNEKIDHVISRTKKAAKDALKDVQKGFDATNVLEKYLTKLNTTWRRESPEHEAVLVAMLGNAEGWRRAFLELHLQGNKLAGSLSKLAEIVAEMEQRAATVSRNILAKTQRSSQQPGRTHRSQGVTVTSQKPLPTEPVRHLSTQPSSRSPRTTGITTQPNSGRNSSRGLASHSLSASTQSPRSPEGRRDPRPDVGQRTLAFGVKTLSGPRVQSATQRMPKATESGLKAGNDHPIELPADVPQDLLHQVPVSVNNRRSMALGRNPENFSEHRASSIYYPSALGHLWKSPGVSLLLTPQSSQVKGTPVLAVNSQGVVSGRETDYFFSHEQSPSIGRITPDSKHDQPLDWSSPRTIHNSARASIVGSTPVTRRSSGPNLAFTSHPAVMSMALPPSELPANTEHEERPASVRSKEGSEPSVLGEPGPETSENMTTVSSALTEAKGVVGAPSAGESILPAPAEETTPVLHEKAEMPPQLEATPTGEISGSSRVEVVPAAAAAPFETATCVDDECNLEANSAKNTQEETRVETMNPRTGDLSSTTHSVAELVASIPEPQTAQPEKASGPVELEAPFQPFRLPPRLVEASEKTEKDAPRASITQLEDFFKLPIQQAIEPGLKPKDFGNSDHPQLDRPLRLKLAKKNGKIVPVQVDGPEGSQQGGTTGSKLKIDVVANLIETMSHTPPGSPSHSPSFSLGSSSSAQSPSHGSSHSWGPPGQAAAPPGPGGRTMVNPDFAEAGHFEGERKQKKKGKAGSKSGWKSLFGGNANAAHSPSASSATTSGKGKTKGQSSSETATDAGMIKASGNDLVWFRGDMKKALGVSSA